MNDPIEELRDSGLVLLVYDIPRRPIRGEDGEQVIFADQEDPVHEVIELASMNQIRVTQDAEEEHDCLLVLADIPGWDKSPHVTRQILLARRRKQPVYYIKNGRLVRSC
jgi:hypothetical protein